MKSLTLFLILSTALWAAESVPFIVTAEGPKAAPVPVITLHDVVAQVNNQPANTGVWHPLKDDPAGLELWLLVDDGTSTTLGTQLNDIKAFIRQLPPQVKIAVGYLQNGSVVTARKPTTDREAAVKAIRLPEGLPGISASPYIALADFLHKLPAKPAQPREVVLISSGVDPYYGPGPQNPYLENAFHDAQKLGVPVYTIYYASAGHAGHSYWLIDWGQNDLSELSEATGGEFYWQGSSNPVALKPFFDDINRRFGEQYVMSLDLPANLHRGFERLQLHTEARQVSLVGPTQVYIP